MKTFTLFLPLESKVKMCLASEARRRIKISKKYPLLLVINAKMCKMRDYFTLKRWRDWRVKMRDYFTLERVKCAITLLSSV